MGEEVMKGFGKLESEIPLLGKGRARGLLVAIEIYETSSTGERFETKIAPLVVAEAAKRGLICRSVTYNQIETIVIAQPLIITKEHINDIMDILKASIKAVTK